MVGLLLHPCSNKLIETEEAHPFPGFGCSTRNLHRNEGLAGTSGATYDKPVVQCGELKYRLLLLPQYAVDFFLATADLLARVRASCLDRQATAQNGGDFSRRELVRE